ncbi:ABC transporter substrate-binding protein [Dongia soli]|uniref:ABC transporter substrate-binding protein n=1 Tax=Dongia soli TaxID=600628 RepID=A0ABU5EE32_9PROT|nr:ABC transporter substrate-binding protein [Dongia soli]MDY0883790.1 ABC transporter substrate-binding protein [Dongia soli]
MGRHYPSRPGYRRLAVLAAVLTLSCAGLAEADPAKIGNCELTGGKGTMPFSPARSGQLTVEVNLPGPGWWNGETVDSIKDGYEYCMAANIAWRAGLENLTVVNVSWDALVAGQTKNFDLALSQISITEPRKKVVEFSIPYFDSDIGVLVRQGTKVNETSIKDMRFGVQQATTGADFVINRIKPAHLKVFPDTPSMFTALMAGQVDVALTDTAIVLGQAAHSDGTLEVAGQYSTGEKYGALYPKGSPNKDVLNKIIQSLIDDGTLQKLATRYLAEAWGADPTKIPYFKP